MTSDRRPSWIASRVAHPVRDLDRALGFYRDLLGLPVTGGFTGHDGYDGAFLTLPGGGELELTTGPASPSPGTDEDLLVLYVRTPQEVSRTAAGLAAAGHHEAPVANPYWQRWGRCFPDPDGYRVVVAVRPGAGAPADDVRIEVHAGDREALRPLFELAEDSPAALAAYLDAGTVLVAVTGEDVLGHLQLVDTAVPGRMEITNMAVRTQAQRRGIGARLVRAAVDRAAGGAATELVVATAAADVGNLAFYQRQGFRMRAVERDAFTPARGYPPGSTIDGIPLRDRVWLDRALRHPG
jgi:ribosomal protein S18 acetylase RimI-like enzyme